MKKYVALLYAAIVLYLLDNRDPKIITLKRLCELDRLSDRLAEINLSRLQGLIDEVRNTSNYLPMVPTKEEYCRELPDIELGSLIEVEGVRFGLTFIDRWPTIVIAGHAGAGKTVLMRVICKMIYKWNKSHPEQRITLIISDSKRDFVDFPSILGDEFVLCSPQNGLKLGLNGPEDLPYPVWVNQITRSLAARLGLIAARTTLAAIIHWLLPLLNPDMSKQPLRYPSLQLILEVISQVNLECFSAKADYSKSLIQGLSGIIQDNGPLWDCSNGLEINRDIIAPGKHLILDVKNLSDYVRHYIEDLIILQGLVPRIDKGLKSLNNTAIMYVIGEGDFYFKNDNAYTEGLSPLSNGTRIGREEQIMFAIEISALENVPRQLMIDARDFFIFNMANADFIRMARSMCQIDPRCDRLISSLRPGQLLRREIQGCWSDTVLAQADFIPPARNSETIRYDIPSYIPAHQLKDLPEVKQAMIQLQAEHKQKHLHQTKTETPQISKMARNLLDLARLYPFEPVHLLFSRIGNIPKSVQKNVRDELRKNGFALFVINTISKRRIALMELTNAAYTLLGENRPPIPAGDICHKHYSEWIRRSEELKGHKAIKEAIIPGTTHPADVAFELDGFWYVYEVVNACTENLSHHLEACFVRTMVVKSLTIVTGTKAYSEQIKAKLEKDMTYITFKDRIHFGIIDTYAKEIWK